MPKSFLRIVVILLVSGLLVDTVSASGLAPDILNHDERSMKQPLSFSEQAVTAPVVNSERPYSLSAYSAEVTAYENTQKQAAMSHKSPFGHTYDYWLRELDNARAKNEDDTLIQVIEEHLRNLAVAVAPRTVDLPYLSIVIEAHITNLKLILQGKKSDLDAVRIAVSTAFIQFIIDHEEVAGEDLHWRKAKPHEILRLATLMSEIAEALEDLYRTSLTTLSWASPEAFRAAAIKRVIGMFEVNNKDWAQKHIGVAAMTHSKDPTPPSAPLSFSLAYKYVTVLELPDFVEHYADHRFASAKSLSDRVIAWIQNKYASAGRDMLTAQRDFWPYYRLLINGKEPGNLSVLHKNDHLTIARRYISVPRRPEPVKETLKRVQQLHDFYQKSLVLFESQEDLIALTKETQAMADSIKNAGISAMVNHLMNDMHAVKMFPIDEWPAVQQRLSNSFEMLLKMLDVMIQGLRNWPVARALPRVKGREAIDHEAIYRYGLKVSV